MEIWSRFRAAYRVLTNPRHYRELETWFREDQKIHDFVTKNQEFKNSAAEAMEKLISSKGWQILNEHISQNITSGAIENLGMFEDFVSNGKNKEEMLHQQIFQAGIIRGYALVLNFPNFIRQHHSLNTIEKEEENG